MKSSKYHQGHKRHKNTLTNTKVQTDKSANQEVSMEEDGKVSEPTGGDASKISRSRPHDIFSLPPMQLLFLPELVKWKF